MVVLSTLIRDKIAEPTAVAIGYFDGVHLGHKAVLKKARSYKAKGLKTGVFTFSTASAHPKSGKGNNRLVTKDYKIRLMRRMGVDYLVMPEFSEIMELSPEAFVKEVLREKLNARVVCCGDDFRFGKNACGDTEVLKKLCEKHCIDLVVVPKIEQDGKPISSTRIRTAIEAGKVDEAEKLLGRPYSYDFEVVHGRRVGRTMDFPTINQFFDEGMLIPKYGVYASYVVIDGAKKAAVTNIGVHPTFKGSDEARPVSETFVIDYTGNLYKQNIEVCLIKHLRSEKFAGVEELKEQMAADAQKAEKAVKKYFAEKDM